MTISQLSIFIENKPGRLAKVCRLLSDAGVNTTTLSLADTREFGIVRLLAKDWRRARDVLSANGIAVHVSEVAAVEVPDRPGGMTAVLDAIDAAGANIEYNYAFSIESGRRAVLVFRFTDPEPAASALEAAGFRLLDSAALFGGGETQD